MKGNCTVDECDRPIRCKGLCEPHYRRLLRTGRPEGVGKGRPLGPDPSYIAIHFRLTRTRGAARKHKCVDCQREAASWSYNHRDPDEKLDNTGRPFSSDLSNYDPRCWSCHNSLDAKRGKGRQVAS